MDKALVLGLDGLAADRLDEEEDQPSPVQRRDGQQVEDAHVDGQQSYT